MEGLDELMLLTDVLAEHETVQPAPLLAHVKRLGFHAGRRRIYLGEISEDTGTQFQQMVHMLNNPEVEELVASDGNVRTVGLNNLHLRPIHLWLNTPGGDVTSMFAIHDAIRTSAAPVHIYGYGQVCSAGVLILAAGARRLVTESCCLMSHETQGMGDAEGLGLRAAKDRREWEDWQHSFWCELMARYTPNDAKWWRQKTEKKAEYWLLGGAAIVAAGLADEVIDNKEHA